MVGNSEAFETWLKQHHNKILDAKLFQGYKFFIECAFSEFFDSLTSEKRLGIKENFLFQRAVGETFFIERLPNTCERVVFLKNIYSAYKPIAKAKNSTDLKEGVVYFQDRVLSIFDTLIEKNCELSSVHGLTSDRIQQLILIENLYIHFSQINNNGPVAYNGSLMKQFWLDNNRLEKSLDGYKYALQYAWLSIVGMEVLNTTSLRDLHTADSWKKYIYLEKKKGKKSQVDLLFGDHFDLSIQTSLDSYFYRIQDEVIHPLEEKHQINILDVNDWVYFDKKGYSKKIFNELLLKDDLPKNELTSEETLDMLFYWYPIEAFQPGQMHNGIPAFITSLAGTVTLKENEGESRKVMVRKFIHPYSKGKNDYSYSIFIDSQASAGHYYSGWLLYFDCCSDHSGFSGSEYKRAEEIIKKYKEVIELKSLNIKKGAFKDYIAKYISSKQDATYEAEQIKEQLDDVSNKRLENTLLGNARGLLLELVAYYIHSQKLKVDSIKWNTEKSQGEIDVIIEHKETITIIECKVNPNNCDLSKEYEKIIAKLNNKNFPNKKFEFWFWIEPSLENKKWLRENNINYTVLSNNCTNNEMLKGFDIGGLKYIFG